MTNLCQALFIWTVALTITIANGGVFTQLGENPALEDYKFPSTNFIPSNLKIGEGVYDNLLGHLADQLSVENVNINANDYFPKGKIVI